MGFKVFLVIKYIVKVTKIEYMLQRHSAPNSLPHHYSLEITKI